jgi:hypothetical protein
VVPVFYLGIENLKAFLGRTVQRVRGLGSGRGVQPPSPGSSVPTSAE